MGLDLETGDSYLSNGHSSDPPDPSYSFVIDSLFVIWLTEKRQLPLLFVWIQVCHCSARQTFSWDRLPFLSDFAGSQAVSVDVWCVFSVNDAVSAGAATGCLLKLESHSHLPAAHWSAQNDCHENPVSDWRISDFYHCIGWTISGRQWKNAKKKATARILSQQQPEGGERKKCGICIESYAMQFLAGHKQICGA